MKYPLSAVYAHDSSSRTFSTLIAASSPGRCSSSIWCTMPASVSTCACVRNKNRRSETGPDRDERTRVRGVKRDGGRADQFSSVNSAVGSTQYNRISLRYPISYRHSVSVIRHRSPSNRYRFVFVKVLSLMMRLRQTRRGYYKPYENNL